MMISNTLTRIAAEIVLNANQLSSDEQLLDVVEKAFQDLSREELESLTEYIQELSRYIPLD